MSRPLDRCGVVWRALDRVSPWLAIAAVVVGYVIVHKQGQEIQSSRRDATISICLEANHHHFQAERFVNQLVAAAPKPPKPLTKREQAAKTKQVHLFLEAIAPYYGDCVRRADRLTKP